MTMPEAATVVVPRKSTRTYVKDLTERAAWTFAQTAGSVAFAAGGAHWMDISMWKGAAVAGLAAAGSVLKGAVARFTDDKNSASTVPGV